MRKLNGEQIAKIEAQEAQEKAAINQIPPLRTSEMTYLSFWTNRLFFLAREPGAGPLSQVPGGSGPQGGFLTHWCRLRPE